MKFDSTQPFEKLTEFDSSKSFEKVSEFDPSKSFDKVKAIKKVFSDEVVVEKEQSPLSGDEILKIIRGEIKNIPIPKPQRIVEKIIEREVSRKESVKKDLTKYAEEKSVEELKKELSDLKSKLEEVNKALLFSRMGGSGVIGIPIPEGNNGKSLQVVNNQAVWKTGGSDDVYTPSNVTTTLSFDATNTSLDELASVLGSLIASLQSAGIIQ